MNGTERQEQIRILTEVHDRIEKDLNLLRQADFELIDEPDSRISNMKYTTAMKVIWDGATKISTECAKYFENGRVYQPFKTEDK